MIKLPDNLRADFDKWFYDYYGERTRYASGVVYMTLSGDGFRFKELPFEMQIGVWIAYCESKDFLIEVTVSRPAKFYRCYINAKNYAKRHFKTRQEAEISAINQALKLISEQQ